MDVAVFLDRDNTLIANDGDLGDPESVRLLDGVGPGLKRLRQAGYRLIVVTNQGGVARGRYGEDDVDAVHQRIALLVDEAASSRDLINRFYYCPYHPDGTVEGYRRDHPWRKPRPGMLLQAARDLNLDLARCWMIGDQTRDIEAGRSAGCRTVLVEQTAPEAPNGALRPTVAVQSFSQAVQEILRRTPPREPTSASPTPAPPPAALPAPPSEIVERLGQMQRSITDLTEEIRSSRSQRAEFTGFRLAAGMAQLLAGLLALLGLLQLASFDTFVKWMVSAALVQLATIALLLLDLKE